MRPDAEDARAVGTASSQKVRAGFAVTAALLAVAFVAAATAGVLAAVGPYLLGVSVLVAGLFALGLR